MEFTHNPDHATPFLSETAALTLGMKIGAEEVTTHHYGDQTRWLIVMPDASFVRLDTHEPGPKLTTPRKVFKFKSRDPRTKKPFQKNEADDYLNDAG